MKKTEMNEKSIRRNKEGNSVRKKQVNFYTKLFIYVCLFIALFCSTVFSLKKAFYYDVGKIIKYQETSNLDYRVYLKENDFYEVPYLDKEQNMVYISELIDYLDIRFTYDFNVASNQTIDFTYSITGKLTIGDANSNVYFQREYELLKEKQGRMEDAKSYTIDENLQIKYDYYNQIANSFKSTYGIDTVSNFMIYLKINKNSVNDKVVSLNNEDTMTINIPLSEKSVNIKLDYKEIHESSQLIDKSNISLANKFYMVLFLVLVILLVIVTIKLVHILTSRKKRASRYDRYIKKLLLQYDRLIVETTTYPELSSSKDIVSIEVFQELIDVHDNLNLPIMYCSIDSCRKAYFYIDSESKIYLHVVRASDFEEMQNEKRV